MICRFFPFLGFCDKGGEAPGNGGSEQTYGIIDFNITFRLARSVACFKLKIHIYVQYSRNRRLFHCPFLHTFQSLALYSSHETRYRKSYFSVCRCGPSTVRIGTKVVGGENAIKGEIPWQIALTTREKNIRQTQSRELTKNKLLLNVRLSG